MNSMRSSCQPPLHPRLPSGRFCVSFCIDNSSFSLARMMKPALSHFWVENNIFFRESLFLLKVLRFQLLGKNKIFLPMDADRFEASCYQLFSVYFVVVSAFLNWSKWVLRELWLSRASMSSFARKAFRSNQIFITSTVYRRMPRRRRLLFLGRITQRDGERKREIKAKQKFDKPRSRKLSSFHAFIASAKIVGGRRRFLLFEIL